jgi:hypothetical protein
LSGRMFGGRVRVPSKVLLFQSEARVGHPRYLFQQCISVRVVSRFHLLPFRQSGIVVDGVEEYRHERTFND